MSTEGRVNLHFDELAQLREQLESAQIDLANALTDNIKLREENTRLREALQKIIDYPLRDDAIGESTRMNDLAHEALKPKGAA